MKPSIRDETGEHLLGVDPVQILDWALRDWNPEELTEYHKFVLVNSELSAKRVANAIYEAGGTVTEHDGVDSRIFWLPDAGMVGVFDLSHDYMAAQEAGRNSSSRGIRNYFDRVEYRSNTRIGIAVDAYKMLSVAQLMIIQRNNTLPENQIQKKSE